MELHRKDNHKLHQQDFAAYQHAGPELPAYRGQLLAVPQDTKPISIPSETRSGPGKLSQRLLALNQTHPTASPHSSCEQLYTSVSSSSKKICSVNTVNTARESCLKEEKEEKGDAIKQKRIHVEENYGS